MPCHRLTNFEIKNDKNEPKFNGIYSRNKWWVGNLDEYESMGTHWVALYLNTENVTYFDSFGVEHIPDKLKSSWETTLL